MDEIRKDQEGQTGRKDELPQTTTMPDILAQMRQIFADREEEYTRMENIYQKRKERLKLQEAALQEAQEKLEEEKTEQWMQVSLLREEARNEKIRSQRLAGEYEEKLSKLSMDNSYLSGLQEITEIRTENERLQVQAAALQEMVDGQKEELENSKKENQRLREEKDSLNKVNQKLEELSQDLPEQQKKDMESLHALAKELTEAKEALEEENRGLKEENRRLQEEKGELFKKLMASEQPGTQDKKGWKKKSKREEEADMTASRSTKEREAGATSDSQEEPGQADVLLMEDLLTAEALQEYLQEEGVDARLLHSADGELVAVTADDLQFMFAFRKKPRFDIRKKQKGGWGMKKLIQRYNENNSGFSFTYDEGEEELIGSAEFPLSISPEDLLHKVYQAARIYFGYQKKEE